MGLIKRDGGKQNKRSSQFCFNALYPKTRHCFRQLPGTSAWIGDGCYPRTILLKLGKCLELVDKTESQNKIIFLKLGKAPGQKRRGKLSLQLKSCYLIPLNKLIDQQIISYQVPLLDSVFSPNTLTSKKYLIKSTIKWVLTFSFYTRFPYVHFKFTNLLFKAHNQFLHMFPMCA